MRGDLPEAALRLAATHNVRTHERRTFVHIQGSKETRPLWIDGRRYDSIIDVKKRLHVCTKTVNNWLDSGKAARK